MSRTSVPHYSGWRPRTMRTAKRSTETGSKRDAKRQRLDKSRLGRAIYKSAKGYKHPEYSRLCEKADALNGRKKS